MFFYLNAKKRGIILFVLIIKTEIKLKKTIKKKNNVYCIF